ncbi:MAG: hypothetical protein AB9891_04320 [Anaerolineaceae bacterium]
MKRNFFISIILAVLLISCAQGKPTARPSLPVPTDPPTPIPTSIPEPSPVAYPPDCLSDDAINEIAAKYIIDHDALDLNAVWQTIEIDQGGSGLMSSLTDYNNEFAYGSTWERLLLLGEYEARFSIEGAEGVLHCVVVVYPGGEGPEVGAAISDALVNGEWTGYAFGLTPSEKATRDFIRKRIGQAVTVRYHVAQNPEDADFVRSGFFSPAMRLLWQDSYYTRIPADLNILMDNVGQPRGPNLREMMSIARGLGGLGVFLDYVIDPIP